MSSFVDLRNIQESLLILALDTSTAACTAALFATDGTVVAACDEMIGRGHAERLVPMIEAMLDGHVPTKIIVGVGPGSFTGLRVGIAAAHGMAIGWSVPLLGMNSLALLVASAPTLTGKITAAVAGGHGELFVQTFERSKLNTHGPLANLTPDEAAKMSDAPVVVGTGADALVAARGSGEALSLFPSASKAMNLPPLLRSLDCRPVYARAPDAKPKAAA